MKFELKDKHVFTLDGYEIEVGLEEHGTYDRWSTIEYTLTDLSCSYGYKTFDSMLDVIKFIKGSSKNENID